MGNAASQFKNKGYSCYWGQRQDKHGFPKNFQFHCIKEVQVLENILAYWKTLPDEDRVIAVDTETTDLNHQKGSLVGYSFCCSTEGAFYVPIEHKVGTNIDDPDKALAILEEMIRTARMTLWYNARFDFRWLRENGVNIDGINYYDVQNQVWLMDTNVKMPNLKGSAKWFLGWDMDTYAEAVGDSYDLSYLEPEEVTKYAAGDALATYFLYFELEDVFKEASLVVKIDNELVRVVMDMEDQPIRMGLDYLRDLLRTLEHTMNNLQTEIYKLNGGMPFTINSPQQLIKALTGLGLRTLKFTEKSNNMSTSESALLEIKSQHPIVEKIIEYKKLLKLKTSYVETLIKHFNPETGGCRFSYLLANVPTGRLSSSADKKNRFFAKVNTQSIPKPHPQDYLSFPSSEAGNILGWGFVPFDKNSQEHWQSFINNPQVLLVEGFSQKDNVRSAFLPDEGHLWVSLDYSGQELRIPANLSREPVMVNTFLSGGDLHKEVAVRMWGEENYDGDKRKKAKIMNFGTLYGGTKFTIAEAMKCGVEEAQGYIDQWWGVLPVLRAWAKAQEQRAERYGTISTAFGRPRRLRYWFASPNYSDIGFAKRSAVNTVVQGTGADMMRLALIRTKSHVLSRQDLMGFIRLLSTIHDEANFSMHPGILLSVIPEIIKCMSIKVPDWKVPMEVGIEIGTSWGQCYPFHLENNTLTPSGRRPTEKELEKYNAETAGV